jgi:phosphoglycolate phosphatase
MRGDGCLIVFDMDGTLVDSRAHIARAVRETARLTGVPEPHETQIPRVIGLTLDAALARLFPAADAGTLCELHAVYRQVFADWRTNGEKHEPLFDGSAELIADLDARGFQLGIATGKGRRGVDYILGKHGLADRFVTIQTPDNAPGKPDPGMMLQAMAETGVERHRTVMVGDTTFDMAMARAAGTHAIGVSWGNHAPVELRDSGAHAVIERWSEFMHAVAPLFSE